MKNKKKKLPKKPKVIPTRTLKKYCDTMWSIITKHNIDTCECCHREVLPEKKSRLLNSHHLITRGNLKYRFELMNCLVLCAYCHKFSPKSIHTSFWFIEEWLKENKKDQYDWFLTHRKDFDDEYVPDYMKEFLKLNELYVKIFGKDFKTLEKRG